MRCGTGVPIDLLLPTQYCLETLHHRLASPSGPRITDRSSSKLTKTRLGPVRSNCGERQPPFWDSFFIGRHLERWFHVNKFHVHFARIAAASGPLKACQSGTRPSDWSRWISAYQVRYVQWAKITHHTNNPRYSWMDCGVPTSIRGQLPSVELHSEPFSNATHCQRAPLGRTESGFAKTCGR
jgi:hypothetical protein